MVRKRHKLGLLDTLWRGIGEATLAYYAYRESGCGQISPFSHYIRIMINRHNDNSGHGHVRLT